jgi:hypothetical protein
MEYEPNHVPLEKRLLYIACAVFLLAYGTYGLVLGELYIPGRFPRWDRLAGAPMVIMCLSMMAVVVSLVTTVIDHYDRRDNEHRYYNVSFVAIGTAGFLFFLSLTVSIFSH